MPLLHARQKRATVQSEEDDRQDLDTSLAPPPPGAFVGSSIKSVEHYRLQRFIRKRNCVDNICKALRTGSAQGSGDLGLKHRRFQAQDCVRMRMCTH